MSFFHFSKKIADIQPKNRDILCLIRRFCSHILTANLLFL